MNCQKLDRFSAIPAASRAIDLHRRGFTRGAIDILEAELVKSPDCGNLWWLRAILLHKAGRLVEALHDMEQAQMIVPIDDPGRLILADGQREVGRHQLAADSYRMLSAQPNVDFDLQRQLFHRFTQLKMWRDAAAACRHCLELSPDDDRLVFAFAQTLKRLGQPPNTLIPLIRQAVNLAPTVEAYRVALVIELVAQRRCEEAYDELRLLPVAEVKSVCCTGCLRQLLGLAIGNGDGPRAAVFAAQLAIKTTVTTTTSESFHG